MPSRDFPTLFLLSSTNDTISFYQYIVLNPGEYSVTMSVISDKKVQWEDSINATADDGVIGHLVNIPIKDISKRDLSLKVVVSQNNNTSSKSFPFKIKGEVFCSFAGFRSSQLQP